MLEYFVPALALTVGGILYLDPLRPRFVTTRATFRNNSFEILVTNHPEEIDAVLIDVIGVEKRWVSSLRDQGPSNIPCGATTVSSGDLFR